MADESGSWIELRFDNDYEIYTEYPYPIRKKSTGKILSESLLSGYLSVFIKRRQYKHRLIALQWIENDDPENKLQIDHINRDKLDNRIENLRWCTRGENMKNKGRCVQQVNEYLDELPDNVIEITEHDGFRFKDYYYDIEGERILKITRWSKIKIIKPTIQNKFEIVALQDIYGKSHTRSYKKLIRTFKKLFD